MNELTVLNDDCNCPQAECESGVPQGCSAIAAAVAAKCKALFIK